MSTQGEKPTACCSLDLRPAHYTGHNRLICLGYSSCLTTRTYCKLTNPRTREFRRRRSPPAVSPSGDGDFVVVGLRCWWRRRRRRCLPRLIRRRPVLDTERRDAIPFRCTRGPWMAAIVRTLRVPAGNCEANGHRRRRLRVGWHRRDLYDRLLRALVHLVAREEASHHNLTRWQHGTYSIRLQL
jgi:hypothetical protein